ncbi:TPA: outer membrane-stress sensor serine endopeptidase DegS [Providencia stuartii]|uniref:outer membrane-stress sensor serine endopeptidase DegS n=1 Tax=Providencia stuartii TaxID=588 RepID=UPI00113FFA48|nr:MULTISPECIES: outer membrane-stress sensor serine endopeptidase DegS [Providencia]MBN5561729.1 outer membrane-stress sensor serine endopeptidase DegS [Providencia stuartii]MBN5601574.1 outer membrane-stress sensor serine endopeptidase DegS [Providencia stuartii]MBN5605500.1 outer membrane-stress sensor serine endopeptidase DegS [Providencia stuartii]MCL8324620.1 outer membrane-stress sensor serine endopeptidase DegS [Providencia thailandensis]MDF4174952.1 outer membrane-stress sensor serine
MVKKLIWAAMLGLLIAMIIIVAVPSLRPQGLADLLYGKIDSEPVSYNKAVRKAAPAVVYVYSSSKGSFSQSGRELKSLGSGVIMSSNGYIITNKHVVDNPDQILVALQDGSIFDALLVGSDALTDLAVLKIDAENLPVIPINKFRITHVGDVVLAIGNPYNIGQTVTQGIISATGRVGLSSTRRQNFLQTDASINSGNSGGALINSEGELVGINTLSFSAGQGVSSEGLSFAIPTALATKIMEKLIRDGRVIRGYIGITARELPQIRTNNNNIDQIKGLRVFQVAPNGPAAKSGILQGDIILSVDNKPAISAAETMDLVAEIRPGSKVPVKILRDGEVKDVDVIIEEIPEGQAG